MTTTISNRIYVEEPSQEVVDWAKENLRIPNPEYAKKERMGFWLGRTPKELRMYEWNGRTLILPFGVCREIMPLLRQGGVFTDFRQNEVIDYGTKGYELYDYQEDAVQAMFDAKFGILKAITGSGKTIMALALIKMCRRRALWLCHTQDLLKQSMDRAKQCMDESLFGTITEGKVDVGAGITFATVQTMANLELTQYRDYWDVVIVDECFPGNTDILTVNGLKKICDITKRDKVIALDGKGNYRTRKIRKVFRKKPETLVKVTLENGKNVYCTANHPILTERGYVHAGCLTDHDSVYCLRSDDGYIDTVSDEKAPHFAWKGQSVLFGRVQDQSRKCLDRGETGKISSVDDPAEQENIFRTNEEKQFDEKCGNAGERKKETTSNASTTWRSWRKWEGVDSPTADTHEGTASDVSNPGIRYSDKDTKRKWLSNLLQGRHRISGEKGSDRDRWELPLLSGTPESGQKERRTFEFVRVESVEIQEQTGDGTYGGLCPDGYVYNLHVSKNHNYFANGMNVHNCHRVASSATSFTRYEKVLNHLAARRKIGVTATPQRADGLIKATFALMGKVMHEVPEEAIADRVMGVRIRPVDTETEITDECLNVDGTVNYVKLIEHLTTDVERNVLIARKIIEEKGHSCLILSDRLAQLEAIRALLPYEMQEESAFINGKMTSKKAKAERETALDDMRTGKKKYLFSSYSLSREGLDIPRLDRLFLASPAKYSAIITQAVGRVRRTADGKETPIVYDFKDSQIGFCERAFKERCRSYRQMGAEIERGFLR